MTRLPLGACFRLYLAASYLLFVAVMVLVPPARTVFGSDVDIRLNRVPATEVEP